MSIVKFSEVAHRAYTREDRFNTEKIYYVGGEHIDSCELYVTKKGVIKGSTIGPMFYCGFTAGQILFVTRNPHLKKCSIADFDGICSEKTFVIETKDESILTQEYLAIIMQSDDFWNYCEENKSGGVNYFLNWSTLADYEFELPPIKQQLEIAQKVMSAYRLKQSYKKLLDATREMVKSQFIEMFGNQNTNDKGWTESLVKDEFKLSMGKTPARNNPECWDNGTHKWVSISDMSSYTRYTGDTSEYITDYAIADSGIKAVPKGTIIMSFKLSIGRTAITSEDLYTNEAIMAFAGFDEKKFNIDFLHFLIANKNWLLGAKQAVKGQTLNKESIGNAKIIIPPIEAQEEFASIYNQADKSEFVGCKSQFIEMFGDTHMRSDHSRQWKEVVEIINGKDYKSIQVEDGGYPVYGTGGEMARASDYLSPANSILLGRKGTIDKPLLIREKYWNVDTAFGAVPDEKVLHYVYFYWHCKTIDFNVLNKGTTLPSTTKVDLLNLWIKIPSMEEQTRFGSIVEQADKSEYYN